MFTLSKHSFEDKLNSPNNNLCLPPKSAELKKKKPQIFTESTKYRWLKQNKC